VLAGGEQGEGKSAVELSNCSGGHLGIVVNHGGYYYQQATGDGDGGAAVPATIPRLSDIAHTGDDRLLSSFGDNHILWGGPVEGGGLTCITSSWKAAAAAAAAAEASSADGTRDDDDEQRGARHPDRHKSLSLLVPIGRSGLYHVNSLSFAASLVASGQAAADEFFFFAGSAGWGPGQLQGEIDSGTWFVTELDGTSGAVVDEGIYTLTDKAEDESFGDAEAVNVVPYRALLKGCLPEAAVAAAAAAAAGKSRLSSRGQECGLALDALSDAESRRINMWNAAMASLGPEFAAGAKVCETQLNWNPVH
jgi:putative AlgH/UPF0301 family transcriptional regulator